MTLIFICFGKFLVKVDCDFTLGPEVRPVEIHVHKYLYEGLPALMSGVCQNVKYLF